ncbi:MAG: trehalose-phosphatase [Micrococcales bacterium]|nr:trehalose-phosphatase [Micrococcales bacterium]
MPDPSVRRSALSTVLTATALDPSRAPLLVALDFDGTLAPLQDDPQASRILPEGVAVLERLAAAGVHLALVSGRGLATLAQLAQVPVGTFLVGSHGGELGQVRDEGLGLLDTPETALTDDHVRLLAAAGEQLSLVAQGRQGVWVEVKPAAVVMHTRVADDDVAEQALTQARTVGARLGTQVLEGKDVVELAVLHVDKGTAVASLRATLGATTVVFAGDDRTDENVQARLGPHDVGIKVGPGATLAKFHVDDPQAVVAALEVLADALTTGPGAANGPTG